MKLENEKTRSYLRIFFCMVLIIIWATWIINAPTSKIIEPGIQKKKLEAGNKMLEEQNTKLEAQISVPEKVELPKLVDLQPKGQDKKLEAGSKKLEEKNLSAKDNSASREKFENQLLVLKLPDAANATRKVLLQDNSLDNSVSNKKETLLRKKVPINNSATQKSKTEDEIETSWLPKYIIEKNELPNTIKNLTINLDQIASQIDFTGLIKSIQGPGAAIIKNNANNTIEILKIGEEYKGLQLLEISENEITLGNPELEKRYIKKLITQIKDQ